MSVQPSESAKQVGLKLSALPDDQFMEDYSQGSYDYNAEHGYRTEDNRERNSASPAPVTGSPGKVFQVSEKKFPYTFAFGVPRNGYPQGPVEVRRRGAENTGMFFVVVFYGAALMRFLPPLGAGSGDWRRLGGALL